MTPRTAALARAARLDDMIEALRNRITRLGGGWVYHADASFDHFVTVGNALVRLCRLSRARDAAYNRAAD